MGVVAVAFSLSLLFAPGDGPPPPDPAAAEITAPVQAGDEGAHVENLQSLLVEAGFRPGVTDGSFGGSTRQAVLAFQKHHGLERTGVFLPEHLDLLTSKPDARLRSDADRVEVDLAKQVLYLVVGNEVEAVLPISSGNGASFENSSGRTVRAVTPEGRYDFYFQRNYMHTSYLGAMYKPFYFRGGYAIHGSPSVPAHPASHGCIRVTNADMDYLRNHLEIGMAVYVYGLRTTKPQGIVARSTAGALPA